MSKRADIERAMAGNVFRNEPVERRFRSFLCAYCGKILSTTYEKVGILYYHKKCPKVVGKFILDKIKKTKEAKDAEKAG